MSADGSGAHVAVTTDDLSLVVEHMKKSNGFVKTTNQELIKMNKGQGTQNRWLKTISLLLTIFIGVLLYGLWMEKQSLDAGRALIAELEKTNIRLDDVVVEQKKTKTAAEDTKKAIDEQPTITVKPADTTDPTSRPTLIVQPKTKKPPKPKPKGHKKGDPPPPPAAPPPPPPALEFHPAPKKKK